MFLGQESPPPSPVIEKETFRSAWAEPREGLVNYMANVLMFREFTTPEICICLGIPQGRGGQCVLSWEAKSGLEVGVGGRGLGGQEAPRGWGGVMG